MNTVHLTATADELERVRVEIRAARVHEKWAVIDAIIKKRMQEDTDGDK